ncbi:outer membrane protein transport protein [Stigmatella sp. ncwal1]|uniref:Outer membrane protein transport protein n=1 Tax=Stigmatella ashevillensis TaxID=2995309 RepID=A0ABT5D8R6_9BACT|nr:outer membrane protein transport protein [Stigmatella ashevillena]MDC0710014.1 outer membrane protein transport protein [Stigmatella ashevillena]
MRRECRELFLASALGAVFAVTTPVQANIDPVAIYDARSAGMGDTGVAYAHGAASLYHNPALLQGTQKMDATVSVAAVVPGITYGRAPIDGPETEVSAKVSLVPSPFVGFSYRLTERIVVGLAAYPMEAYGGAFEDVQTFGGLDFSSVVATIEASPAVSVALLDTLSLGLGYRITYIQEQVKVPVLVGDGFVLSETNLSGANFAGLHAGLTYRPVKFLRLGLSYRSKIKTTVDGTLEIPGLEGQAFSADVASPHRFKAGAACSLFDDRLLLVLDAKMMLYENSHEESVTTVETPQGTQRQVKPLLWKNVIGLGLGAEYAVTPMFLVRAGYTTAGSATPLETADYFTPPPARSHVIHLGAGVRFTRWNFDVGALYGVSKAHLTPPLSNPGNYGGAGVTVALSGTYRL